MTTDLAVQNSAELEALLREQDEEFEDTPLQVPILKVTQGLTKEVKAGDVEAGEFYNTLTGESYGTKVEFVAAAFQKGRAASEKGGRYFVAIGQDTIPESWADLVGAEFVGTPFAEYPDAEEQYKDRVNRGEIEWGKGPLISTTYNYTGLAVPSAVEGSDEELVPLPVRIAFLRTTTSAHDKIRQIKRTLLRGKPLWSVVFELSTEVKAFGRNDAFVVNVKKSRNTTPAEQQLAGEIALAIRGGRVTDNADEAVDEPTKAPEAEGALAV